MSLGKMLAVLTGVRIAGTPTFIPGNEIKRHHTMVTAICNRGKNPNTQQDMADEITLNFWGKYAQTAALYLDKGREINVIGELRSYRHQTGRVRADGRPEIERRVEVLVNQFFFGKDSMKEMSARVNGNLAALKQSGRLPMDCNVTAEEILAVTRPQAVDYNPAMHDASGIYGNAKVWKKDVNGFVGNGVVGTPNTQPAPQAATNNDLTAQVQALQAQLANITAASGAAGAAGASVDPFPG